jgi:hypothetical protein
MGPSAQGALSWPQSAYPNVTSGDWSDVAPKQYGPAMTGLTAVAKLAGLWVDQTANFNGNYAISDKPLNEQEWVEKHVKY